MKKQILACVKVGDKIINLKSNYKTYWKNQVATIGFITGNGTVKELGTCYFNSIEEFYNETKKDAERNNISFEILS